MCGVQEDLESLALLTAGGSAGFKECLAELLQQGLDVRLVPLVIEKSQLLAITFLDGGLPECQVRRGVQPALICLAIETDAAHRGIAFYDLYPGHVTP